MERTVTVIESTAPVLPKKKRVVAYARVSLGRILCFIPLPHRSAITAR